MTRCMRPLIPEQPRRSSLLQGIFWRPTGSSFRAYRPSSIITLSLMRMAYLRIFSTTCLRRSVLMKVSSRNSFISAASRCLKVMHWHITRQPHLSSSCTPLKKPVNKRIIKAEPAKAISRPLRAGSISISILTSQGRMQIKLPLRMTYMN